MGVYYEIRHLTEYRYSAPVQLGTQTLRFRPLSDANQHVLRFEMHIDPEPAGITNLSDLDGNHATVAWFVGDTQHLKIETIATVQTLRSNPFDYVWQGETSLPVHYSDAFREALGPYMARIVPPEVREIGDEVAREAEGQAQTFLYRLTTSLHNRFSRVIRPQGEPLDPLETLRRGEGSCRDLAVLFLAIARSQGFAGRFVSGYHVDPGSDGEHDLHAWPEVYVPGGGWRGFDPTTGLAVADQHVGVAVGALPQQAAPVSGSYAGAATSELKTYVDIQPVQSLTGR